MNPSPGVLELPRRQTLSEQVARSLRRALAEGAWAGQLPGERGLCALLQVSRPTLRTALQLLVREGVIECRRPGRRSRLLRVSQPAVARRVVALVSPAPVSELPLTAYQGISALRAQLAADGFVTVECVCQARTPAARRARLEDFFRRQRVLAGVLLSVTRDVQAWFAGRAIPALVLGSCHPGIRLPSLDIDYRAVCRHAAGALRRKGHHRLALIVPDSGAAGDLASEQGFLEGARGAEAVVVRHDGPAARLGPRLEALLAAEHPPTALLVAKPALTLAVMLRLTRLGIRVPAVISVLARDPDPLFGAGVAHYAFPGEAFARRLSRLMRQLVAGGSLRAGATLLLPRHVAGDTVGPRRG
jgi:DNA-binding LacI/PurR family transcriptional regulator